MKVATVFMCCCCTLAKEKLLPAITAWLRRTEQAWEHRLPDRPIIMRDTAAVGRTSAVLHMRLTKWCAIVTPGQAGREHIFPSACQSALEYVSARNSRIYLFSLQRAGYSTASAQCDIFQLLKYSKEIFDASGTVDQK